MSSEQVWIIGASSECDIVVDVESVSGRHCRLKHSGMEFLLEDLDSTNGTFVNDTRCSGPIRVTPDDHITLGQSTPFPWQAVERQFAEGNRQQVIRIGRLPDNDLVLDYQSISGHHARILVNGLQATIEDLGSTNGTALNQPDQKITSAPLSPHDTVYFGTMRFAASDLLAKNTNIEPVEQTEMVFPSIPSDENERPSSANKGWRSVNTWTMSAVVGIPLLVLLAVLAALSGNSSEDIPGEAAPDVVSEKTEAEKSSSFDPTQAIYSVLATNPETNLSLRLGTAWAVSERNLVSNATVIASLVQRKLDGYTQITVQCPSLNKEFSVTTHQFHPQFEQAAQVADDAWNYEQKTHRKVLELFARIQALNEISASDDVEINKLKQETQTNLDQAVQDATAAQNRLFQATEKISFCDVGILRVNNSLPVILPIVASDTHPTGNESAELIGIPFETDDLWVNVEFPLKAMRNPGFIRNRKIREDKSAGIHKVSIGCDHNLVQQHWGGSPVLNEDGKVIALFVRLTPNYESLESPPSGNLYDAVEIGRLYDYFNVTK